MSSSNPNQEATVQKANGFTAVRWVPIAKAPSWAEAMGRSCIREGEERSPALRGRRLSRPSNCCA